MGIEFVGEDVSDVDLEHHDGAPTYMRVCTDTFMYLCVYLSMCIWALSSWVRTCNIYILKTMTVSS